MKRKNTYKFKHTCNLAMVVLLLLLLLHVLLLLFHDGREIDNMHIKFLNNKNGLY
jgi:hypothetical protein